MCVVSKPFSILIVGAVSVYLSVSVFVSVCMQTCFVYHFIFNQLALPKESIGTVLLHLLLLILILSHEIRTA